MPLYSQTPSSQALPIVSAQYNENIITKSIIDNSDTYSIINEDNSLRKIQYMLDDLMKENIEHVGENISVENASWSFGGDVPKTFEEHVSRSVPLYNEGHDLICNISDFFLFKTRFYIFTNNTSLLFF